MALLSCKECGKEMSSTAPACPHCGARRTSPLSAAWTAIKVVVALFFGLIVYRCASVTSQVADSVSAPAVRSNAISSQASPRGCTAKNFSVSGLKFRREYDSLSFTGTVTNGGSLACGVQLKVSTYDDQGSVVDTADFWPASIRNIEPSAKENFSYFVRYDKTAKKYDVIAIDAKEWKKR